MAVPVRLSFIRIVLVAIIISSGIGSCAAADTGGWKFRSDMMNTGVYQNTSVVQDIEKWNFTAGDEIESTPVMSGGLVYFGCWDGNVYAVIANNGTLKWKYNTSSPGRDSRIESSPAVSDGVVYIGNNNGTFYALNAANGARIWSFSTAFLGGSIDDPQWETEAIQSSATVYGNNVYFQAGESHLYSLNKNSGARLWKVSTQGLIAGHGSPAVYNGMLYLQDMDYLEAVNPSDGSIAWKIYGDSRFNNPAISNGVIYMTRPGIGGVYAINPLTHAEIWHYSDINPPMSSPAVANGMVYFQEGYLNTYHGYLRALYAANGTQKWAIETGNDAYPLSSSPAVANGVVYVGSTSGYLFAVNATTGSLLWNHYIGHTESSPAIYGGMLFIGSTMSHKLYAIGLDSTPPPAVTGISPAKGPVTGGTRITLSGINFNRATAVRFGTKAGTRLTVNSSSRITVTSPAGTAGTVYVTVTTPGGTSTASTASRFTYVTRPNVTGISPTKGPTAGGTWVTLNGTAFTGATTVRFGSAVGTNLTVNSSTRITIKSPAHAAGTVNVTVATPGGTSAVVAGDRFTYVARPNVTAVSPAGGPVAGGTRVTLTGNGFTGATAVRFGTTAGTGLTVNSSTRITVSSPAHAAGSVYVTVTAPGGTSANASVNRFTYA